MRINEHRQTIEHDGRTFHIIGRGNAYETLPEVGDENRAGQTVTKVWRYDRVSDCIACVYKAFDLYEIIYDNDEDFCDRLAVEVSDECED